MLRGTSEKMEDIVPLQNRGCRVEELWLDLSSESKGNKL